VDEGEIVCIIGANGAGKSTTLRAISRLVPVAKETKMTFTGKDLLEYQPDKVVSELGITHVPEGRRLFGNLTVMENLKLATFARKDGHEIEKDLERVFSIFPRLEERMTQKAATLSGGEQQMLAGVSIKRGRPFCSSSRMPAWRSSLPNAVMCWKVVIVFWKAILSIFSTTPKLKKLILGVESTSTWNGENKFRRDKKAGMRPLF